MTNLKKKRKPRLSFKNKFKFDESFKFKNEHYFIKIGFSDSFYFIITKFIVDKTEIDEISFGATQAQSIQLHNGVRTEETIKNILFKTYMLYSAIKFYIENIESKSDYFHILELNLQNFYGEGNVMLISTNDNKIIKINDCGNGWSFNYKNNKEIIKFLIKINEILNSFIIEFSEYLKSKDIDWVDKVKKSIEKRISSINDTI